MCLYGVGEIGVAIQTMIGILDTEETHYDYFVFIVNTVEFWISDENESVAQEPSHTFAGKAHFTFYHFGLPLNKLLSMI